MEQKIQIPEGNFSKSFRGYSVSEVNEHLSQIDFIAEQANQIQIRLEEKIQNLETEVSRLREVENSLFRALKMAEEAQQNWLNKMDSEVNQLIDEAQKKASKIVENAEKEAFKTKLLADNQSKLIIEEANQKTIQQNRTLLELQAAQKEVASQLIQISELTLEKVKSWSSLVDNSKEKVQEVQEKKGENVPNNSKKVNTASSSKKSESRKIDKDVNSEQPSVKSIVKSIVPKSELLEDESLPTLNKVLEAYAKSNGPKGKIGDIN